MYRKESVAGAARSRSRASTQEKLNPHTTSFHGMMACQSSAHKAWCPPTCSTQGRPLKVSCADTGFGNRIINLMASMVFARVLQRPLITFWATPGNIGGRRHSGMRYYGSLSELRAVVSLPSDLQFIEDWPAAQRGGNSSSKSFASLSLAQADYVPVNSLNHFPETIPGYGLFTPESVWGYWQAWARARIWPPPEACVSRSDFAKAFRTVFDEVRPRIDLQNPPSRSYLALHVREGDKRRVPAHIAASVRSAAQALGQRTGLPWVVISDNETAAIELEAALKLQGVAVVSRPGFTGISRESMPQPATQHHASLRAVVRDFFALSASAGVLIQTSPFGGWIDSSFSSTATAVGDTPLLLPTTTARGGSMALLQERTNQSGSPLHSCFFTDQMEAFVHEVGECRRRPF